MTINSASILHALDRQMGTNIEPSTTFSLMLQNNAPCRKIGVEELRRLAMLGHVCARWRGNRILSVQLLVPADEAFADVRVLSRKVRDAFRNQANETTIRASETLPDHILQHHAEHCSSWSSMSGAADRMVTRYDASGLARVVPAGPVDPAFL